MNYLVTEEWREIAACLDGSRKVEMFALFDEIHEFTTSISLKLRLSQSCISTSMTLFHKYYLLTTSFKSKSDYYLSSSACVLIASKLCNEFIPINDLARECLILIHNRGNENTVVNEANVKGTEEMLFSFEFDVLNKIGFDLNIDLPYRYMDQMVPYLMNRQRNPKFLVISTSFVNDSFKLPICLYYSPKLIALAGIYMTKVFFNINLPDTLEGLKWYQIIDKDLDLDSIIEVSNYFSKIYEFSSNNKNKHEIKLFPLQSLYNLSYHDTQLTSLNDEFDQSINRNHSQFENDVTIPFNVCNSNYIDDIILS